MRLAILFVVLTACNAPSAAFWGVPATQVLVDGSTFDIRVSGDIAEAVRVNSEWAPRAGPVQARARFAMEQVSGCKVRKISGDQVVITGVLNCTGLPRTPSVAGPERSLECDAVQSYESAATGEVLTEFDCFWRVD